MTRTPIHLDSDFGGDPDDACALALLLATPHVEVTGITTNLDPGGYRAGCVRRFAEIAGAAGRRVPGPIAGAGATLTGDILESTAKDARYWGTPVAPDPAPPGAALDAIDAAISGGIAIVTIGALTNLALLETARPGALASATVVAMGGWMGPLAPGLPQWGSERDFNLQCDRIATEIALPAIGDLTLVTLPATATAHLTATQLPRLRAAGPLGELLARQAEVYAADTDRASLAAEHDALPHDLLNFHWDPVTCAVATGWDGATIDERDDVPARKGRPTRVVLEVDGPAFSEHWLDRIERLGG